MQHGWTGLHRAACKNSKDCLAVLLAHGAKVNIQDKVCTDKNMNYQIDNDNKNNNGL